MRRLAVLLLAPSLIAAAPSGRAPSCQRIGDGLHPAAGLPSAGGFRRLDQLPPANEYLTVLRSEDGCQKPVIVRFDVARNSASGG